MAWAGFEINFRTFEKMKRIIKTISVLVLSVLAVSSCKFMSFNEEAMNKLLAREKNDCTREYQVGDFMDIVCDIPCSITYFSGDSTECSISMPSVVEKNLVVECSDGVLTVYGKTEEDFRNVSLEMTVKSSALRKIKVEGSGTVCLNDPVIVDTLSLVFSGSANIEAEKIDSKAVDVFVKGAGSVDLSDVNCMELSVNLRGAGYVDIDDICCTKMSVNINGAGSVGVEGKAVAADITVSGAGSIDVAEFECPDLKAEVIGVGGVVRE